VLVDNREPVSDDEYDVTLVSFGTFNRINTFNLIHDAWPGPKVAVFTIYNYTEELRHMAERELEALWTASQQWSNVKVSIPPHAGITRVDKPMSTCACRD
jgi:hypothetical protein